MSDHNQPQTSDTNIFGKLFILAVVGVLLTMLSVVGFAFVAGTLSKPVAAAAVAATPAPKGDATAAATTKAPPAAAAKAPATAGAAAATTEAPPAAAAAPAADAPSKELGASTYATCMACHGPDGKGVKVGPMLMAPSFTGSELLLHENSEIPILIVLKGVQKEGMEYMGMMAALGAALDDEKIAAVLTHVRTNFGNSGKVITTAEVAAARAKFADVPAGMKRGEILKIIEAHK